MGKTSQGEAGGLEKSLKFLKVLMGRLDMTSLTTSEGRIISRPINKIYPLECSHQNFELENGTVDTEAPSSTSQSDSISKTRPSRQAKQIAARNIQQYYSKDNESDSE